MRLLAWDDVGKAALSLLHLVYLVFVLKYGGVCLELLALGRPVNKGVLLEALNRKVD